MSLIDAYKQKLEAQIQEHKAHLDLLKAKAKRVAAQGKILGHQELRDADKHFGQAKAKFQQLKGAGSHAWADLQVGIKNALSDLKVSSKKAAKHFDSHPSTQAKAVAREAVKQVKKKAANLKRPVTAKTAPRKKTSAR